MNRTTPRREEARRLRESGFSGREIARRMGVTPQRVSQLLRPLPARPRKTRLNDLSGRRYGLLVARRLRPERDRHGNAVWLCDCDCGARDHPARANDLRGGSIRSCGCRMGRRPPECAAGTTPGRA